MTNPLARFAPLAIGLTLAALASAVVIAPAGAQDSWDPFKRTDPPARSRRQPAPEPANTVPPLRPMDGSLPPNWPAGDTRPPAAGNDNPGPGQPAGEPLPGFANPPARADTGSRGVVRQDLDPIVVPDGTGLPLELWRGVDMALAEALIAPLPLPPRSAAMHALWRRLLASEATPPAGAPSLAHFRAVRLEGLYRSGLVADMGAVFDKAGDDLTSPLVAALAVRRDLVRGNRRQACEGAKPLSAQGREVPPQLKAEAQLILGYCAAADGNAAAAGLAAEIAREEGVDAPLALQVLDGLATGAKPKVELPSRISVLDYRFLELLGPVDAADIFDKAEPALLVLLATTAGGDPRLRVAAADAAARLNAIEPDVLADIWRAGLPQAPAPAAQPDPLLRRAALLRALETEPAPARRAQLARALLDDARRSGLYLQTARVLAKVVSNSQPGPDTGALAETAIEVHLAAGQHDAARRWAQAFPALGHWLTLIDIDDARLRAPAPASLAAAEEWVRRGRFEPIMLHRLATVLDAIDTDVPLTIWDGAARTPQPTGGFLPDTGMLSQLQDAAKKKETGRVALIALRALGPGGADGANLIALGDTIRALRRAGLEADARHLAFEALFAGWPRGGVQ